MTDWQSWAALGVVFVTIALFGRKIFQRKPGCGGSCGCEAQTKTEKLNERIDRIKQPDPNRKLPADGSKGKHL